SSLSRRAQVMTDRADIDDGLAIPATLQISAETRRRAAASFVKRVIVPTIAAAFETYPELDVPEVSGLCVQALSLAARETDRIEAFVQRTIRPVWGFISAWGRCAMAPKAAARTMLVG